MAGKKEVIVKSDYLQFLREIKEKIISSRITTSPTTCWRNSLTLDFLDVAEPILEREIERKLIANLKNFIKERFEKILKEKIFIRILARQLNEK